MRRRNTRELWCAVENANRSGSPEWRHSPLSWRGLSRTIFGMVSGQPRMRSTRKAAESSAERVGSLRPSNALPLAVQRQRERRCSRLGPGLRPNPDYGRSIGRRSNAPRHGLGRRRQIRLSRLVRSLFRQGTVTGRTSSTRNSCAAGGCSPVSWPWSTRAASKPEGAPAFGQASCWRA